ncbi:hypothetical protein DVA86_28080 [Streptomyces armeniacus]|uniref:ATP/GTP-binding protein n=1 Tax=Streptomyces armeniacus TaxID=83291 RepID=A0A345Y1F2_9ACTN|nr:hypothetical protein DVA86_28080 [Streptomyces armeniacus]
MSLAIVGASAIPAFADGGWGSVQCDQNPHPGCELGAGREGSERGVPPKGHGEDPDQRSEGSGGSGDRRREEPEYSNPDWNRADCSYERSGYKPPTDSPAAYEGPSSGRAPAVQPAVFESAAEPPTAETAAEPKPGEKGAWYVYRCEGGGVRDALYQPPVWIPDGEEEDGPEVSPTALAEQARSQLRLPSLSIKRSPAAEQLVNLPTWLWLERGRWRKVSATASVPGVSVTVTARPTAVDWSMGDGSSRTCKGPGTPYGTGPGAKGAAQPKNASPDCGHTYRASSAGEPDEAYPVSATVRWSLAWSGAGESGAFPGLTTTSSAAFRVEESQAVNTDRQ